MVRAQSTDSRSRRDDAAVKQRRALAPTPRRVTIWNRSPATEDVEGLG
jgi:hypothetical protein